MAFNVN